MRSALLGLVATVLASTALAADVCNGHAELCDQLYSGVTFIGAHNSYAVGEGLGDNQFKGVTDQLVGLLFYSGIYILMGRPMEFVQYKFKREQFGRDG